MKSSATPPTPSNTIPSAASPRPAVASSAAVAAGPAAAVTEKLQMSIPEYGLGLETFALPQWKAGDLVCAQWDEDRCWYKARIDERIDEDRYRVTFFEYGNSRALRALKRSRKWCSSCGALQVA